MCLYRPYSKSSAIPEVKIGLLSHYSLLRWIVAGTTIWSGASYLFAKDGFRIVSATAAKSRPPPPS